MSNLPLYYSLAGVVLTLLVLAIIGAGRFMGKCKQSGAAAKSASYIIAVGYAACGLGGIVLASVVPVLAEAEPFAGMIVALGIAILALGIGFAMAMSNLSEVVDKAFVQAKAA